MKTFFHKGLQMFCLVEYRMDLHQYVYLELDKTYDGLNKKLAILMGWETAKPTSRKASESTMADKTCEWNITRKRRKKKVKASWCLADYNKTTA